MRKVELYQKGRHIQLSENLLLHEVECQCVYEDCNFVIMAHDTIESFQKTRDGRGCKIIVRSGHRCQRHNHDEKGAKDSNHVRGDALDLSPGDGDLAALVDEANKHFDYVIPYWNDGFCHCDNRSNKE